MAIINIKTEIEQPNAQHKYLHLGDGSFLKHADSNEYVSKKLKKTDKTYNDKFWGTLGYFDKSKIDWSGDLMYSANGNFDEREGVTDELKQILVEATGENELNKSEIRERYISFDNVEFPEDISRNKTLRLTLFLNPGEGALVFYQHYDIEELNEDVSNHKGYDYDFIFPEATQNESGMVDFNTDKRDRLNYEIDILPKEIYTDIKDTDLITKLRFVVKILTFKRKATSNKSIIEKAEEKIFKTDKKYKLMVFDLKDDCFVVPEVGKHDIDSSKKTLFLIHGTFADTATSYDAILDKEKAPSLLKQYLEDKGNPHKQVIAFNHQTMFDDAEENTEHLMNFLDDYKQGFIFKNRLDVIGTSRGALVAKYLAIEHERNIGNNSKVPIDKIITVSGANGCGYLTKGKTYINTILKILNKGSVFQKVLVTLAQVSVKYITSRKGLELMKPGSTRLDYILNYPVSGSITDVLTLSADFQVVKAKGVGKKIKNFFLRVGDRIAQTMLGKQHDFVIGTIEQQISDPYPSVFLPDNKLFNAIHGQVLGKPGAWGIIVEYLKM